MRTDRLKDQAAIMFLNGASKAEVKAAFNVTGKTASKWYRFYERCIKAPKTPSVVPSKPEKPTKADKASTVETFRPVKMHLVKV
jgi:transposase